MNKNIQGVVVPESEVSADLGFANVNEFRRWQTKLGMDNGELKHALRSARGEASGFQWHVKRMHFVLGKIREYLTDIKDAVNGADSRQLKEAIGWNDPAYLDKLILAADVVAGRGVDWDHILKDWLDSIVPNKNNVWGDPLDPSAPLTQRQKEKVRELIMDFKDWEWCNCSECHVDANAHGIVSHDSLLKLADHVLGAEEHGELCFCVDCLGGEKPEEEDVRGHSCQKNDGGDSTSISEATGEESPPHS